MSGTPRIFDRSLLLRRRTRYAANAAAHSFLLDRVADDFAERLPVVRRNFANVVNLGSYHGPVTRAICGHSNVGTIANLDSCGALLSRTDGPKICADEETLPLAPSSVELIVSGLALHLVNDLPGTFAQCRRALKPDGLFLAALLGGETLREIREAWILAEVEIAGGASPRVAPFADVRQLGSLLQRAGFALPVVDSDIVRVTYETPLHLMRDLKVMGMSNMLADRRRVPVTRRLLTRAAQIYEERFVLENGRVPATFEIITLTGWAPDDSQPKPLRPGSATHKLAEVLGDAASRKQQK